jgi:uncharacterized YkwD family protein/spore coat assembly protein SafA
MNLLKKGKSAIIFSIVALSLIFVPQQSSAETLQKHTVRPGETLWVISQKYHVSLSKIIQANPQLWNPHMIFPYQQIYIPAETAAKPNAPAAPADQSQSSWEEQVVQLVNAERQKQGLNPLQLDKQLSNVARAKSQDMRDNNYFSHQSPTYGSPFDMMKSFGISYRYAGENIAAGQRNPEEVMKAWMNSSGHRANILNPNYTHIGVGLVKGGSYGYYWTQMFIGK